MRVAKDAELDLNLVGEVADSELGKYYEGAELFALTSMPYKKSVEGYGLVYLEAGHYGLPSIAHRIGGVPEVVIDGKTGLLADPGDRATLVEALRKLIEDPALRKSLGEQAHQYAHRRSWKDNVKELFLGL